MEMELGQPPEHRRPGSTWGRAVAVTVQVGPALRLGGPCSKFSSTRPEQSQKLKRSSGNRGKHKDLDPRLAGMQPHNLGWSC